MKAAHVFAALLLIAGATSCDGVTGPNGPATVTLPANVAVLDAIGRKLNLVAVAKDAAGVELPIPALTWASTTASVTVDQAGVATATSEGDATISATYSPDIKASTVLQVRATITFTAQMTSMQNAVASPAKATTSGSIVVQAR